MAPARKMLRAMGVEDEKAEEIVEAHAETVTALNASATRPRRGPTRRKSAPRGPMACAGEPRHKQASSRFQSRDDRLWPAPSAIRAFAGQGVTRAWQAREPAASSH